MRAREFVSEARFSQRPKAKMHHDHAQVQPGVHLSRDIGGYDRIYHMNRIMMAAACADGKGTGKIPNFDSSSWYEKYNTMHPYTEVEHNMVKQAMATVPTDGGEIVSDHRSLEPDHVHRISPVRGFKGYPR
jgi:hypothetical protein